MKKTYKDVDPSLLNAIPNPDKKTYEIKIKHPELTFLGVYDQPDFASLYILFYPDKTIVELKSFFSEQFFETKKILYIPNPYNHTDS